MCQAHHFSTYCSVNRYLLDAAIERQGIARLDKAKGQPMRAIISVANRDGLPELARELQNHGVAIFSTSGTLHALQEAQITAQPVSELTQFPEILCGRVKTLH